MTGSDNIMAARRSCTLPTHSTSMNVLTARDLAVLDHSDQSVGAMLAAAFSRAGARCLPPLAHR